MDDNNKTTMDKEKAEVLLNQFSSVFTKEPDREIPQLEGINITHEIDNLVIIYRDCEKTLQSISKTKSDGPDPPHGVKGT